MKTGMVIKTFNTKDGRKVILRTPKWEDLDDFLEFINSLVEEGADIDLNKKVTREGEAEWLGRQLAALEKGERFWLVAEVDRKVIGNSSLSLRKGYSSHVGGIGIAIMKGYRNVGIGTEMLRILIDKAREMDLKIVLIDVFATNERAHHVYKKVGFKETGRRPRVIYKNGKYTDKILMAMELN